VLPVPGHHLHQVKETTMSRTTSLRRGALIGVAAASALAIGAGPALAHHCYVPMYSLEGPSSPNWLVISAEGGAAELAGFVAPCPEAADAGYDALESAGLPVGIKIFEKMTIGDPKATGRTNPNGADGHGLEYFGAGSTLAEDMVFTWIGAASGYDCGTD
jgi:hypothetical protein